MREHSGWSQTQVKRHMDRLEELEYLVPYRMRGPLVVYELAYGGGVQGDGAFVVGLKGSGDSEGAAEDPRTTGPLSMSGGAISGVERAMSGSDPADVRPLSGGDRGASRAANGLKKAGNGASPHATSETALPALANTGRS